MPPDPFKQRADRLKSEEKLNEILERMQRLANVSEGDNVRLTDKVLLQLFSFKLLNNNDDDKTLQLDLPQTTAFFHELVKEDNDPSPEDDPVPPGEDPLMRILQDVEYFSRLNYTTTDYENFGASEESKHAEGRLAKRIYRRLNRLMDEMNAQNDAANRNHTGDYVDDDRMFAAANLLNYFDAQLNGRLGLLPEQQIPRDAIHFTYVGKYMGVSGYEQPMSGFQNVSDDLKLSKDLRSQPLFPHAPSVQDVRQEQLGDCWFLSTLSEIAARRPEKLEEMMRDNQDGTVTVRFYHRVGTHRENECEPFFVTVDKVRSEGQAAECLWVDVLERALAVSGMGPSYQNVKNNQFYDIGDKDPAYCPQPKLTDPPTLDGIAACSSFFAMELLLGDDVQTHRTRLRKNGVGPMTDAEVTPIDIERNRIPKEEQKLADKLGNLLKQGALISTNALEPTEGAAIPTIHGLAKLHEYALIGLERKDIPGADGKPNPHYFVKLRNPHGTFGRDYRIENGKLQAFSTEGLQKGEGNGIFGIAGDNNGVAYIEMGDYLKEFKFLTWGDIKESSVERSRHIADEERSVLKSYTQAFKEINSYLDDKIPLFSHNSGEYKDMKNALKEAVKNPAKNYLELEGQLDKIGTFVTLYRRHAREVQGNEELRITKEAACDAFDRVLQAAQCAPKEAAGDVPDRVRQAVQRGFVRPKAYARGVLAGQMLDAYLQQNEGGPEHPEVQQLKDKIEGNLAAYLEKVQNTAEFQRLAPQGSTIVEMAAALKRGLPAQQIKAEHIDNSYVKRETKTIGDVRAANEQPER